MSTDTARQSGADPSGATYTNSAEESTVSMQVGVMHGDAYFYQMTHDTPEEKFRVGRNYLNGNAQQQAERLIRDAFMSGDQTAQVGYYWSLAILSGRSFDHLGNADFDSLTHAFSRVEGTGESEWRHALAVVSHLMHCLIEQDSRGEADPAEFHKVMSEFEELPQQRREEIHRHLEMILDGGLQDQIDATYAEDVRTQRMSDNRRGRAWKFFEPDPTPPLRRPARPAQIPEVAWLAAALGGLVAAVMVVLLLRLVLQSGVLPLAVTLAFGAGGSLVALRVRWNELYAYKQRQAWRAQRRDVPDDPRSKNRRNPPFSAQVKEFIESEFRHFRPLFDDLADRWDKATQAPKNALYRELVETYQGNGKLDDIKWLVRWYARDAAKRWRSRTLTESAPDRHLSRIERLQLGAGIVAAVGGIGTGVVAAISANVSQAILVIVSCGIAFCLLLPGLTSIHLERRRFSDECAAYERRHEEQLAAYDVVRMMLADRPNDTEMARWLDHDKAHVRMLAMRHYRLSNRGVFAHAVLSEGWSARRRARVLHGPPRYSNYLIRVYLLTESGVRQFAVKLDFQTGLISNEERFTFRYEAIASAAVAEIGARFDLRRPRRSDRADDGQTTSPPDHDRGPGGPDESVVLQRVFELALVNSQAFRVRVENFDHGLLDKNRRENLRHLLEMALDSSGITGALHILETVAAEGKDWIPKERMRRNRRPQKYKKFVEQNLPVPVHKRSGRQGSAAYRAASNHTRHTTTRRTMPQ
jgi:hypothetical protein